MTFRVERSLSIIGTVFCVAAVLFVGWILIPYQPIWPLPALYLVELVMVCCLGTWDVWQLGNSKPIRQGLLVWLVIGILYAFVLMGIFSVGLLFLPTAVLFITAGFISARKVGYPLVSRFAFGVVAAAVQSGIMLFIITRLT